MSDHLSPKQQTKVIDDGFNSSDSDDDSDISSDWDEEIHALCLQRQSGAAGKTTQFLSHRGSCKQELMAQFENCMFRPPYFENRPDWEELVQQKQKEILDTYDKLPSPEKRMQYAKQEVANFMDFHHGISNFDLWTQDVDLDSEEEETGQLPPSTVPEKNEENEEENDDELSSSEEEPDVSFTCEQEQCQHCNNMRITDGLVAVKGTPKTAEGWWNLHLSLESASDNCGDLCPKAYENLPDKEKAEYVLVHTGIDPPGQSPNWDNGLQIYNPQVSLQILYKHPVAQDASWEETFREFGVPVDAKDEDDPQNPKILWEYLVSQDYTLGQFADKVNEFDEDNKGERNHQQEEYPDDEEPAIPIVDACAKTHNKNTTLHVLTEVEQKTKNGHSAPSTEQVQGFFEDLQSRIMAHADGLKSFQEIAMNRIQNASTMKMNLLLNVDQAQQLLAYCEFAKNPTGEALKRHNPELYDDMQELLEIGLSSWDESADKQQQERASYLASIIWLCQLFQIDPTFEVEETDKEVVKYTMTYAIKSHEIWDIRRHFEENKIAALTYTSMDNANNGIKRKLAEVVPEEVVPEANPCKKPKVDSAQCHLPTSDEIFRHAFRGCAPDALEAMQQGNEDEALRLQLLAAADDLVPNQQLSICPDNSGFQLTAHQEDNFSFGTQMQLAQLYHNVRIQFDTAKNTAEHACKEVTEMQLREWQLKLAIGHVRKAFPTLEVGSSKWNALINAFAATGSDPVDREHEHLKNNTHVRSFMGKDLPGSSPCFKCDGCNKIVILPLNNYNEKELALITARHAEFANIPAQVRIVERRGQRGEYAIFGECKPVQRDESSFKNPVRECRKRNQHMLLCEPGHDSLMYCCDGFCYKSFADGFQMSWGTDQEGNGDAVTKDEQCDIDAMQAKMEEQEKLHQKTIETQKRSRTIEREIKDNDEELQRENAEIEKGCELLGINRKKLDAIPIRFATQEEANQAALVAEISEHFEAQQKLNRKEMELKAKQLEQKNLKSQSKQAKKQAADAAEQEKAFNMANFFACNDAQTPREAILELASDHKYLDKNEYDGKRGDLQDLRLLMGLKPYMLAHSDNGAAEYYDWEQMNEMLNERGVPCAPPFVACTKYEVKAVREDFAQGLADVLTGTVLSDPNKAKLFMGTYDPSIFGPTFYPSIGTQGLREEVTHYTKPHCREGFFGLIARILSKMDKEKRMDFFVDGCGDKTRKCVLEHASENFQLQLRREHGEVIDMDVNKYEHLFNGTHSINQIKKILWKQPELGDADHIGLVAKRIKRKLSEVVPKENPSNNSTAVVTKGVDRKGTKRERPDDFSDDPEWVD